MIPFRVSTSHGLENIPFIFPSLHATEIICVAATIGSFLAESMHSLTNMVEPQVKETPLPLEIEAFQVRAQRRGT
jgi:hypothetical protein